MEHVSLEQALLLKELGFNWNCSGFFAKYPSCDDYIFCRDIYLEDHNDKLLSNYKLVHNYDSISAPSIFMVLKWLREVKNLHLYVYLSVESSEYNPIYEANMQQVGSGINIWMHDNDYHSRKYKTYEAAINNIITIALEYLKKIE